MPKSTIGLSSLPPGSCYFVAIFDRDTDIEVFDRYYRLYIGINHSSFIKSRRVSANIFGTVMTRSLLI